MNPQTPDYKAVVEALDWDVKMWRHIILYTGNEGAEEPVAFISSYSRMSRQKMLSKRRYSPQMTRGLLMKHFSSPTKHHILVYI
jgi:hypothetical protein